VENGRFRIADESYRILVIPSSTTMRCSVADKVAAFSARAAKWSLRPLPTRSMERGMDRRLAEALSSSHRVPDPQAVIEAIRRWGNETFLLVSDPHIYYLHRGARARYLLRHQYGDRGSRVELRSGQGPSQRVGSAHGRRARLLRSGSNSIHVAMFVFLAEADMVHRIDVAL